MHSLGGKRKKSMKTEHRIFNGSVYLLIHIYKSCNNVLIKEYTKVKMTNHKLNY